MSEGDNGKGKGESGSVVQIADRRSSSGATKEPEKPVEVPAGPKDRNAKVRPMVVNRNQLDPFKIIQDTGGSWREGRRAVMLLRDKLDLMQRAAGQSFRQLSDLVGQLEARDVITHDWFSRPWWRRWFRRPPTLPCLQLLQIEPEEETAPQGKPEAEPPEPPDRDPPDTFA